MYIGATYILVIIGAVISMLASINVKSTFKRYSKVFSARGIRAEEVAQLILDYSGITDVRIERVSGELTDHYAPGQKVLRLSDVVYGSSSVAAIGVAAHECGHAVQHHNGYGPLHLRSVSVPVANIGSKLSWPVIILGLAIGHTEIAKVGIFLFLFVVLFQLLTLPVEFNASHRAMQVLENKGILGGTELSGARKVLAAAAMTYVASLFNTILQLLRIILIVNGGGRRRR